MQTWSVFFSTMFFVFAQHLFIFVTAESKHFRRLEMCCWRDNIWIRDVSLYHNDNATWTHAGVIAIQMAIICIHYFENSCLSECLDTNNTHQSWNVQSPMDLLQKASNEREPVLIVHAGTMLAGSSILDNSDPWPFPDMFRPVRASFGFATVNLSNYLIIFGHVFCHGTD